jgi:hypothetical protein
MIKENNRLYYDVKEIRDDVIKSFQGTTENYDSYYLEFWEEIGKKCYDFCEKYKLSDESGYGKKVEEFISECDNVSNVKKIADEVLVKLEKIGDNNPSLDAFFSRIRDKKRVMLQAEIEVVLKNPSNNNIGIDEIVIKHPELIDLQKRKDNIAHYYFNHFPMIKKICEFIRSEIANTTEIPQKTHKKQNDTFINQNNTTIQNNTAILNNNQVLAEQNLRNFVTQNIASISGDKENVCPLNKKCAINYFGENLLRKIKQSVVIQDMIVNYDETSLIKSINLRPDAYVEIKRGYTPQLFAFINILECELEKNERLKKDQIEQWGRKVFEHIEWQTKKKKQTPQERFDQYYYKKSKYLIKQDGRLILRLKNEQKRDEIIALYTSLLGEPYFKGEKVDRISSMNGIGRLFKNYSSTKLVRCLNLAPNESMQFAKNYLELGFVLIYLLDNWLSNSINDIDKNEWAELLFKHIGCEGASDRELFMRYKNTIGKLFNPDGVLKQDGSILKETKSFHDEITKILNDNK